MKLVKSSVAIALVIVHSSCMENTSGRATDSGNSRTTDEEFEGNRDPSSGSNENSKNAGDQKDSGNFESDGMNHDTGEPIEDTDSGTGDAADTDTGSGDAGPQRQWSCPDGPFPSSMAGTSTPVCMGFKYNYGYNEGPTWIASQNAFFFSNFVQGSATRGDIIKYTPGKGCEVFLHDVGCNGLGVGPTGNLIAACHQPRAVMEFDVRTKESRVLADRVGGKMLDSPNDLVAHSNGTIYFTNPTYELAGRPAGLGSALLRIDPEGMVSVVARGEVNGIALSPDEKELYVVQLGTWSLDDDGVPLRRTGDGPGGDGISVDCSGRVYNMGTNSAFGGADAKTMLIVGPGTSVRVVQRNVPGLP